MTPKMSDAGIEVALGGSAWNWNLLTPTGMGPTMIESRTWSCLVLSGEPT